MKKLIKFFAKNWEVIAMIVVIVCLIVCVFFAINTWHLGTIFKNVAK